jgi:CRISPR/Cas system-associated exonuclease Cas4 (RecB family)
MRIIRASEIGSYLYCQRAWWYQLNDYQPENTPELEEGKHIHEQHSRGVWISRGLSAIASVLIVVSLALVILWLIQIKY